MDERLAKKRNQFTHENLLAELRMSSASDFKNFLRMNCETYEELLLFVGPFIKKKDTQFRNAIPVSLRLSTTLRFFASGCTFEDLKFSSAVSSCAISRIVMETCDAIIKSLDEYIKVPQNEEEWKIVANEFYRKWNFPNCIGAVDGKHVAIRKPHGSGSYFYNYKKFFSVVLMAVVNANYEFLIADVGINGRISDGGVFRHTSFGEAFYGDKLGIPKPNLAPCGMRLMPYVFVGDDAFQLTENFMKPFAQIGLTEQQKTFNYRLSRARRVVENAFGILTARFGVFQRAINLEPEKANKIVLACCYLHNFLRRKNSECYETEMFHTAIEPERLVPDLVSLQSTSARNSCDNAKQVREKFVDFFNNEGQLPWGNQ